MLNRYLNLINIVKGEKIRYIGRAASLCWIGFGKDVQVDLKNEKKRTLAEFALHIQCSFRVCKNRKIKFTNLDMYEPSEELENYDNFNWDVPGNNLFDINAQKLTKIFEENFVTVEHVILTPQNDLTIKLSGGWEIEIFNNGCYEGEIWRFFKPGSEDAHIVVYSNAISYDG